MPFDPISAALDIGGKLIDRLWPDPGQRDAAKLKLLEMQQSGELAQLAAATDLAKAQAAINQAEASSGDKFASRWRPMVGYACAAAFAYHFVAQPLLAFILSAAGHPVPLPAFNMDTLMTVLLGILGLGGARTFEKIKGAGSGA